MNKNLVFYVYRGSSTTSDQLMRSLIDQLKHFVFESQGVSLAAQGYSGIPLVGTLSANLTENEIYKVLSILFRLSIDFEGLVFTIKTENLMNNPFYVESHRNDVLPKWAESPEGFVDNVFGYGGVIHVITPEIAAKYTGESKINIVQKEAAKTRNILVTEALKQKLDSASLNSFGMHRTSVNLPSSLAYVARERPDLLNAAIREFLEYSPAVIKEAEKRLSDQDNVVVHVLLNENDWKTVTDVADIESPEDIVSHRISLALILFDKKHSSIPNGVDTPTTETFLKVSDLFEREHLETIRASLFGTPHSVSHMYQTAKALTTNKHHAECRRIFVDESSSADQTSICSGDDDESYNMKYAKKQISKKKKRNDLGRKRELVSVISKPKAPETPTEDPEMVTPTSSGQLKSFERAVNGDDIYYRGSSDEDSLGEDEDMDLFVSKSKKKILEAMKKKQTSNGICEKKIEPQIESDEEGFDVADLLRAAPPLAKTDDFDDI